MATTKDECAEKVKEIRLNGLEIAQSIMEANKAPSNTIQIDLIKTALLMYETFKA